VSRKELIEVSLIILHETEKAYQVTEGLTDKEGKEIKHWLPKSQCQVDEGTETSTTKAVIFTIPRWLVEEKGFTSD